MRRELQLSEAQAEGLTMEWKGDGTIAYPQLDSLRLPLAAAAVAARAGGHGQLVPHFLGCYRHGTG